jgi:hypothetical protein
MLADMSNVILTCHDMSFDMSFDALVMLAWILRVRAGENFQLLFRSYREIVDDCLMLTFITSQKTINKHLKITL